MLEEKRYRLTDDLKVVTNEKDELLHWKEFNSEEWEKERKILLGIISELQENIGLLRNVSSDSSAKLQQTNEKIRGECEELAARKDRLIKEREDLDEKINTLTKSYNQEKKEREKLEDAVAQQQNDTGLNLSNLRKKLQSYVWEDLNIWNVLLEIRTDVHPEDFHAEKMDELKDHAFVDQIKVLDQELQIEIDRLNDLQAERAKESSHPEGESLIDIDEPKEEPKEPKEPPKKR